jgi:hypothetical protein
MDEDDEHMMTQLRFTIQVKDRVHLAHLIRNLRRVAGVNRVERERGPIGVEALAQVLRQHRRDLGQRIAGGVAQPVVGASATQREPSTSASISSSENIIGGSMKPGRST